MRTISIPSAAITVLFCAAIFITASVGIKIMTTLLPEPSVMAANVCNNSGSVDAGETCSNCPYDVRCSTTQKCIADSCSSASWSCKREDICGDGWVSAFEVCDDGGICTGSTNAGFVGRDCFTLDPRGDPHEGVARCRGTGGICVAQNNDGCEADCQTACFPDGDACLTNLDCCGSTCTAGTCV
ncbi:MAG TPA: hypothetical protein VJB82_03080 [Candidatus Peribacterales bacterium]|nr:hypothetical protein [Candidatus Peribacterales bacterium]